MKLVFAPLVIVGFSTAAVAQSGPTTLSMSCDQARSVVASQGAVVLRTGSTTYDRYVRDESFCIRGQMVRPAWVRTADVAQCPVGGVCRSVDIDNGQ